MKDMKFKADALFTGTGMLQNGEVLITDEKGVVQGIVPEQEAGDNVIMLQGVLCPGFVNTHCHLELSHMKGKIAPGSGLVDFLIQVIRGRNQASEGLEQAMKDAATEMHTGGVVAVGDICNTAVSAPMKSGSSIAWHSFIEVLGFTDETAQDRLLYAEQVRQQFDTPASLSPHAPYSVSATLFHLLNKASEGMPVTIHNQETPEEDELYLLKQGGFFRLYEALSINPASFRVSGKPSLQTYLPWLGKASDLLLVHNTFTHENDVLFTQSLAGSGPQVYYCLCPNANQYISGQLPPVEMFCKHHCILTIGTDSYASNHQLSILSELLTLQQAFPAIPLCDLLQWATLNGARALRLQEHLGSFEKGKKPGVVLISDVEKGRLTKESVATRVV